MATHDPPQTIGSRSAAWLWTARAWLPTGEGLSDDAWNRRHRGILVLLWAHVLGVPVFGLVRGFSLAHVCLEGSVVAVMAAVATSRSLGRQARMLSATLGLMSSSGLLVHLSGGVIEMHFHFFVMVAVVSLYQSWLPFLVAIGFVLVHHGVIGVLDPTSVYNHTAAERKPWLWATIHASFVLAESVVCLIAWRANEIANQERATSEATAQERTEELAHSRERFRSLLQNASDAVLVLTDDLRIQFASDSTGRVLGCHPDDLHGRPFTDFVRPEEREVVQARLRSAGALLAGTSLDHHFHRPGGWTACETVVANLRANPSVGGLVLTTRDVTDQRSLQTQLRSLAFHDQLTGLANRALLRDAVEQALAEDRRHGTRSALLFVDLDDFKTVNDSLGHCAGDQLLVVAARRIEATLRSSDTVARLGGDEFAVLLRCVATLADAETAARRVLSALGRPVALAGRELLPRASVGLAVVEGGSSTVDDLLRDADAAMYEAKSNGKGRCELFQPAMHTAAIRRLEIEAELRRAIERRELCVRYQPIVALGDGRLRGVEALVRWQHPLRGLLSPAEFIPVAEETGLIVEIGRWVLGEACREVAAMAPASGTDFRLSVNLSARQIADDGLEADVAEALARSGLAADRLVLEITETALMADTQDVTSRMARLRDLGIRFAIDDFGTGYSSLAYLRRFPLQFLKIDRSFVAALGDAAEDSALVRAVLSLAHTFGMEVVAEGIEYPWQAEQLQALGCPLGQGYLFGSAEPAAAIQGAIARQAHPAGPGKASAGGGHLRLLPAAG